MSICEYFGKTDSFTVDFIVFCGNGVFLLYGSVVGIVSTISSLTKGHGF